MDLVRTSLKVSAAALLTAPVLFAPLTSTSHYGSLAHRLASYPSRTISTESLDRAMHRLVAQFSPAKEATGTVLASISPSPPLLEKPAQVVPPSILAPTQAETAPAAFVSPSAADALSHIASLGKNGSESDSRPEAKAYAPPPELQPASTVPDTSS